MSQPGNQTRASTVRGEHSRKEPLEQLINSYSEHLIMSARQVEKLKTWLPSVHVLHEQT
jgi:hypothetical protein